MTPKHIMFHDYGGHAFTAQLARHIARSGIRCTYVSFKGFATPKGRTERRASDPAAFKAVQIDIAQPFDKDNLLKRHGQQRAYARLAADCVLSERPQIVVSSNCPLEVQKQLQNACHRVGGKFVFWLQDLHSEAIARILSRKSRLLGAVAGKYYKTLEIDLLRRSDAVIAISDDFVETAATQWKMDTTHFSVLENWAPLEELPTAPRINPVSVQFFRPDRKNIVYSGTLARKHKPELLLELARNLDADIHLFSQGSGADYVRTTAAAEKLDNLFVHPWVGVDDLPEMLAGADILCAFIQADAGQFSVPSKVLAYLCAGKPILASIPLDNLAARTICAAKGGLVSAPPDIEAFLKAARDLLANRALREELGCNGRLYAERTFDIETICTKFLDVISPRPVPYVPAVREAAQLDLNASML